MNRFAAWFRWVVVLGILVNLFFALPGIWIPNAVLAVVRIPPTDHQVWPAFASLLLLLLSLFYIPAAVDPFRYTPVAWLAVLSRIAGAIFFFCIWPGFPLLGTIDLVFGGLQGVLLVLALRAGPDPDY